MDRLVVVICGPESSGKTWLCEALSKQLGCIWVPEFARSYLEEKGPDYDWEDFQKIYDGHIGRQFGIPKDGLCLFDTDSINFWIWSQRVFNKISPALVGQIPKELHHQYLVCAPDLDWEPDLLRENPHDREEIFEEHLNLLQELKRPYQIVRGSKKERLNNALDALLKLNIDLTLRKQVEALRKD